MSQSHCGCDSPKLGKKVLSETQSIIENDCNVQYGSTSDATTFLDSSVKSESRCSKLYNYLITMTIEPVMFCFMFGFIMNMSILTNFMMDIGCLKNLNYSSEICRNLSGHDTEKENVEILATEFSLYFNLLSLIGAFTMIFIAPWSDKYGRLPPLICVAVGSIVSDTGFILFAIYKPRLEYLLLAKIPTEIFGGFICVMAIIYCHASEVTTEKNRTVKYTVVELAMGLGMALGGLTGGFLQRYYGYLYIYVLVGVLHVFCFFWVIFCVRETTGLDLDVKWSKKASDFFDCQSFKSAIKSTFRSRDGSKRAAIVLLLLSMCALVLTYESFGNNGFVYVFQIYNWDVSTYNILTTSVSLFQMPVILIIVPLFIKVFKLKDFTLGIIGTSSMMTKNFLIAFAPNHKIIYYIAQLTGIVGPLAILAIRSGLSKIVERNELGKVFSVLATCEAVIPMAGTIAVTKLFQATLHSFPNVTYLTTVGILLLPLLTFIWASKSIKQTNILVVSTEEHSREKA